MADTMSYHHPAPPSSGSVDLNSLPSHPARPHTVYHHMPTDYSGGNSHAMSQSDLPQQDHGDSSAMGLAAEKRRNKLGYHRTSVACGHCRRRKIRCIPSPNDAQRRCINCIRLKKECSFYPVDQQPPPDARKNSRPSTMAPPLKSEPYPPEKMSGRNSLDYTNAGMANWISADASPNPSKPADMAWRYQESPITPSFPPYTTPPAAAWTPQSDFAGPRTGDDLWSYPQQPPRSLSFSSDTLGSSGHHPGQQAYPSISQMTRGAHHSSGGGSSISGSSSYDRKSSSAALSDHLYQSPASTATTIPGVDSIGTTIDHHVSPSAGPAYPVWSNAYSYGKDAAEAYVNWGDANPHVSEAHAASTMYYTR